jgi:hypothetical protein
MQAAPASTTMIPAGYLYKRIAARPGWLAGAPQINDIYSVSGCVSENFSDYIAHWKHNGHWMFDDPAIMRAVALVDGIPLRSMTLCYYEVYVQEFDQTTRKWTALQLKSSALVCPPKTKTLCGFDVATFSQGNCPECSPLSCNSLAAKIATNSHCLFETFADARAALDDGVFDHSEPGPFRIFAVYKVEAAEHETPQNV